MTGMLASVTNVDEALTVLDVGVDIIDLKQPAQGALGALEPLLVAQIVNQVDGRLPVSATVGDLPMEPEQVAAAVEAMAATGVDYIKVGFFPGGDRQGTIDELATFIRKGVKIVAVLFADASPKLEIIESLNKAGFTGVMLDTMNKKNGSLSTVMTGQEIEVFVTKAKQHRLLCGLAGSLGKQDIPQLTSLNPDYLGFRGALCNQNLRTAPLEKESVIKIKSALKAEQNVH